MNGKEILGCEDDGDRINAIDQFLVMRDDLVFSERTQADGKKKYSVDSMYTGLHGTGDTLREAIDDAIANVKHMPED